jgi:hypothetical protein
VSERVSARAFFPGSGARPGAVARVAPVGLDLPLARHGQPERLPTETTRGTSSWSSIRPAACWSRKNLPIVRNAAQRLVAAELQRRQHMVQPLEVLGAEFEGFSVDGPFVQLKLPQQFCNSRLGLFVAEPAASEIFGAHGRRSYRSLGGRAVAGQYSAGQPGGNC